MKSAMNLNLSLLQARYTRTSTLILYSITSLSSEFDPISQVWAMNLDLIRLNLTNLSHK